MNRLIRNTKHHILCFALHATRYTKKVTRYTLHATRSKGFGIIEVLISSAIIIMVVGATVFLGRMAIRNALVSAQRAQAYNLAREGIEFVRSLRDTRWINQFQPVDEWNDDFLLSGSTEKYYNVDLENHELDSTNDSSPESINLKTDSDSSDNIFYRLVKIEKVDGGAINTQTSNHLHGAITYDNSNDKMLTYVTVIVKWNSHLGTVDQEEVEVATLLSNWKPGL